MIEIQDRCVTFFPPEGATSLIGDFTDWDETPLPLKKPMTIEFPSGAYVEYAFLDAHSHPLADPENAVKPRNPWYSYHRAISLPGNSYHPPVRSTTLQGNITSFTYSSRALLKEKVYHVYEPPTRPVATIYVHDGEAFYHKLHFHEVVDALVIQATIQPVRLVLIEPYKREEEYWFNEHYEAFLLQELMPEVEQRYGATTEQALWGASLGGLVSTWIAWRHSDVFTKIGSMSGCFTAHPQGRDEYHDPEWLTEQLASTPHWPLRFYVQTGQIEWLLAPNRRFAAVLKDKGYAHLYEEYPSGHNWMTWEQGLEPGLRYLFGMWKNDKRVDESEENI